MYYKVSYPLGLDIEWQHTMKLDVEGIKVICIQNYKEYGACKMMQPTCKEKKLLMDNIIVFPRIFPFPLFIHVFKHLYNIEFGYEEIRNISPK